MLVNENKENNENFFFYSLFFFSFSFSFFLFCINLWKKFPLMQFWGKICMYLFIYELGAQVTEKELFVNGSVPPRSRNFYLFVNESIIPSNGILFLFVDELIYPSYILLLILLCSVFKVFLKVCIVVYTAIFCDYFSAIKYFWK